MPESLANKSTLLTPRVLAPAAVLTTGVAWGLIGLFSNTLQDAGFSSPQVVLTRCAIAAVLLMLIMLVKNPALLRIRLRDLWIFLGTGVCSIAFFNVCYISCIRECSMSIAAMLLYTAPAIVTVIAAIVFRERFTVRKGLALALAFAGCAFVVGLLGGDLKASPGGILLGLGAGFGYALYSIFGRVALERYDTFTVSFYTFTIASLAMIPFADLGNMGTMISGQPSIVIVMVLIAIVPTLMPYLLYNYGLQHMETGRASIMCFAEPMVATICGIIVYGDALTLSSIVGIALIAASIVILNTGSAAKDESAESARSAEGATAKSASAKDESAKE